MNEEDRQGYRRLYDATAHHIQATEEFARQLHAGPEVAVKSRILNAVNEHLHQLREDADELEQLGWDSGSA
ncbi:hypothetical protein JJB09_12340 [Rhizobium sp. KVB221]|uniref:Uncharacterized protein n=1 Tax=Rhizobium setariae TaxID=2801340 RepID=A0A937CPP8_9HYPH|nr:hypothetical protein [Rhizobium setariae]MBL0372818.1 hypothetical protein [Rhizobium setariae]